MSDPRTIAVDTLKTLDEFIAYLSGYCIKVGRLFESRQMLDAHEEMIQLVDGIGTFHESVMTARTALQIPMDGEFALLDADFKSILEELAGFHEKNQYSYVADLLTSHLTENLAEWREKAIPEMIAFATSERSAPLNLDPPLG